MASGQQRLPGYVSARRKAARSTQNVPLRMRHARDAPGQTARYAGTEMRDPGNALAGRASRVPWWPRTPSLRRDLALPLVLLALQLTAAATIEGAWHLFSPPRSLGPVDWVLLVVGPVALVARRRHPVPVLWVCFAATLAPSSSGFAHWSIVAAFFG